jgi:hypothetical protein
MNPLVETYNDITHYRTDIYCIDIDGTLTEPHEGTPWEAVPIPSRIDKVNKLYDEGATIYLMTARGFIRSQDHDGTITEQQKFADEHARERTEAQLTKWGVKYHKLYFGKPRAVIYVDDRAMSDHEFFQD